MKLNSITNFIFDLDGVLLDSGEIHNLAFRSTLYGYKINFDYNEVAGSSTYDSMIYLFDKNKIKVTEDEIIKLVEKKRILSKELINTKAQLFPCVNDLLCFLCARNKKIFIATSASNNTVEAFLKLVNEKVLFTDIITSEEVSLSKPNPQIYLSLCKRNELNFSDTIVIEDSYNGLLSARAAELQTVYIGINNEINNNLFSFRYNSLCDLLNFIH